MKTHWEVDPRTGMASCGAGPGAVPVREGMEVTCRRCRKLILRQSKEATHRLTVAALAVQQALGARGRIHIVR